MRQHTHGVNPLTTGDQVQVTRTIHVDGFGTVAHEGDTGRVVAVLDPVWVRVSVGEIAGPFAIYDLAECE